MLDDTGVSVLRVLTPLPYCTQAEGDLLLEELNDIWSVAPKFPDVGGSETRIDVDSFVQIYRDVDDLFEDEDEPGEVSVENGATDEAEDSEGIDTEDDNVEAELEKVYESICDSDRLVSKAALQAWGEIDKLLSDGLLDEEEFDDLWNKTPKSPGSSEQLDVDGFLSFNVALDSLFEFDDEADEVEKSPPKTPEPTSAEEPPTRKMVEGGDLPPGVLFAAIADESYLVGMDELKRWAELQDMLDEGDLLPSELQDFYDSVGKTESGKLSEDGFVALYEKIDALFEEDDEIKDTEGVSDVPSVNVVKEDLMNFVKLIEDENQGEDSLACGLDTAEKDQKQILNIVTALEDLPSNMIREKKGNIEPTELTGVWELIYSSSSAMKFNKGLSGLGGSFPNGRFAGLKQKLTATKFVRDVEYLERIEVTPSPASFDVCVTGSWDLKTSMSLFTGKPSIILNVEPDRVKYGPTSTRADHWKSLGPTNMLDLTYLDEDFRVMRGCTSTETVFLYKRISEES
eukprot:scaffold2830_cov131-Cylindrotheca_fusiformis.AAC.66